MKRSQRKATHRPLHSFIQCIIVNEYNEPECAAISMAKDPYANYVVNTALKVLERGQQRDELFHVLQCKLDELVSASRDLIMRRCRFAHLTSVAASCTVPGGGSVCQADCCNDQDEVDLPNQRRI
jgi:hypothetical protein